MRAGEDEVSDRTQVYRDLMLRQPRIPAFVLVKDGETEKQAAAVVASPQNALCLDACRRRLPASSSS